MKFAILLFALPVSCWANACVATTGNWHVAGTWSSCGGGVPSSGDTATIGSGITVTIVSGHTATVGLNTGGTSDALTITSGTLILNDNLTLARGSLKANADATITLNGVSVLTLATSTGDTYSIYTAGASGNRQLIWNVAGTSKLTPATIQATGSGVGFINLGPDSISGYVLNWTNVQIIGLGSTTHDAMTMCPCTNAAANTINWNNVIIDASGTITWVNGGNASDNLTFKNVTWKNTLTLTTGFEWELTLLGQSSPTGTRVWDSNVMDGRFEDEVPGAFTFTNSTFAFRVAQLNGAIGAFIGDLITPPCTFDPATEKIALGLTAGGTASNNYFYACSPNQDPINGGGGTTGTNETITGNIFESSLYNEHALSGISTGSIINNNISLHALLLSTDIRGGVSAKNNTVAVFYPLGSSPVSVGCNRMGETINSSPGDITAFRNNICIQAILSGYQWEDIGTPATQAITSADYNSLYNPNGFPGYHNMPVTSTAYGVHDIQADPQFVDSSRGIATWDASLGGPGTAADAIAQLSKINDGSGYNAAFTIANLISFVQAGFHPTNQALKSAGAPADGSPDIGALSVVAATPAVRSGSNISGSTIQVNFPGRFVVELGSANNTAYSNTSPEGRGFSGFWDAKNDPMLQSNYCGIYVGCSWTKMAWNNNGGSPREPGGGSVSESPGTLTILEQNSLRVQVKYHWQAARFGLPSSGIDCCITVDEYFTAEWPDRLFETMKVSYDGTDGNAPLTWTTSEHIPNLTWARVSNEPTTNLGWTSGGTPCYSTLFPKTPTPWNFIYQPSTGTNLNKTYLLYTPAGSALSPYPASNDCIGTGSPGLATPGTISVCTNFGCSPSGIAGTQAVAANMLVLAGPGTVMAYPGLTPQYFEGQRTELAIATPTTMNAGTNAFVRYSATHLGDNGIINNTVATEYSNEYNGAIAPTFTVGAVGTGTDVVNGFNLLTGTYVMNATSGVSFTTHQIQHSPMFQVSAWTAAVPPTITVGGVSKALGTDYSAIKLDASTLLLQYLSTSVPDATTWAMAQTGICEATGGGVCYYVDTHSGTGAGTFGAPFGLGDLANPSDGVPGTAPSALHPGDILYFRGGTYTTHGTSTNVYYDRGYIAPIRSGTPGNQITMKAYPGDAVTINCNSVGFGTPLIGSNSLGSAWSYITISGFTLDVSATAGGPFQVPCAPIYIGNPGSVATNVEISYNNIIGGFCSSCGTNNWDGIYVDNMTNPWIHHNYIHGFTEGGSCANAAAIKLYSAVAAIGERNRLASNCVGVFDKESAAAGSNNTYRGNWITGNSLYSFAGNNQTNGAPGTHFIYDNVLDNPVNPVCCAAGLLSNNTEIHNNLMRGSTSTPFILWGGDGELLTNLKMWDNIQLAGGSSSTAVSDSLQTLAGPPAAIFAYSDFNVYDSAPSWILDTQNLTFGQMQTPNGFELSSFDLISQSNIFFDTVSYVVKPPYNTNGRFGDTMGPYPVSTATILDTSQYGPQLTGSAGMHGSFNGSFK